MDATTDTEAIEIPTGTGHTLQATLRVPAAATDAPLLVFLPGMGMRGRYFAPFLAQLAALGVTAVSVDYRPLDPRGASPFRPKRFGYHDILSVDLPAALRALRDRFPGKRPYLAGHSMGGQLGLLYGASHPDEVAGVVLVAAGSVHFRQFGLLGGFALLLGTQAARGVATSLGVFPGHRLGFGGLQPYGVMRDWAHQALTGRYELLGSDRDYESLLAEAPLRVLGVGVQGDTFAPPAAMDHLLGKLARADVTRVLARPDFPDKPGNNHFRWAKHGEGIARQVHAWLE